MNSARASTVMGKPFLISMNVPDGEMMAVRVSSSDANTPDACHAVDYPLAEAVAIVLARDQRQVRPLAGTERSR
jgi:hypothetical protein